MKYRPLYARWQFWFVVLALAALIYQLNQYVEHAVKWAQKQGFVSTTAQTELPATSK